jgi:error-prone DNA polymerase
MTDYAELVTTTNFSFLRGASTAQDLVLTALQLGYRGLGVADRNTLAGVVRAYTALNDLKDGGGFPPPAGREGGDPPEPAPDLALALALAPALDPAELRRRAAEFRLIVGSRLVFADGTPDIIVYPQDRQGWGRLCRLLTLGNSRTRKGDCVLNLPDLLTDPAGLLLIVLPEPNWKVSELTDTLAKLRAAAPGAVWLGVSMQRRGDDRRRLVRLKAQADQAGVPLLACNDVLYHAAEQRDLQDVLSCIREGTSIEAAGRRLEVNAERHLKPPAEMIRLFKDVPEAIDETGKILSRIEFCLSQLTYDYPDEPVPPGWEPQGWLEELVRRRLPRRYPHGASPKVQKLLRDELALIAQLDYARYFLTIHDIVEYAEGQSILFQGRGSAANSAVCYVLGITAVDPEVNDLLFARFISAERREPPDIDVDFEHERREEVIQHIYAKYGRHRAGIAATVISYRPRSAIRDVGKALGLTEDVTARLAGTQWGSWGTTIGDRHIRQAGLDPENPELLRAVSMARRLLGFPRHLSQHVGGFVLTRDRLDTLVPIGNAAMPGRTFIEWDKDDIDSLRLMKVDILALGMLTCIRKALDLLHQHGGPRLGLADVPVEDRATYDMLCRGDSIGVFQVESRAQINMLPRLKPREFYDLVIQVAIVRPGPIQGDMVHPYLRRRQGLEKVTFPSPAPPHDPKELFHVLHRTCGVPLFQEQAMKVAMVAAEFTPDQANGLRRAMATFRNLGTIGRFESLMVDGMVRRGYEPDFARRCFDQIKGFGSYGFPESHAASFAKLVYVSSWLKCHHPAVFACALLNAQPMGFYAPAQIVRDAQEHGVEVRPVDVNASDWDNSLELRPDDTLALRLGCRQIDGFHTDWGLRLAEARMVGAGPAGYSDVEGLARRAALPARAMRLLADADAFRSLGLDRRAALWAVRRLPDDLPLPLFQAAAARELGQDAAVSLPDMPLAEHIVADYQMLRLSLKGHPMGLLRRLFTAEGVQSCAEVAAQRDGARATGAGIVLVRQRPGNGNAIFITLEDETGITNVVLWARLFEAFRRDVMGARLLVVEGRVQKSAEGVVHLMAERLYDRSLELNGLSTSGTDVRPVNTALARADEVAKTVVSRRHPRDVRILPKSRDFH